MNLAEKLQHAPAALARALAFEDRAAELHGGVVSAQQRELDANDQLQAARRELARQRQGRHDRRLPEDLEARLQKAVEAAEAERDRLRSVREDAAARWQAVKATVTAAEDGLHGVAAEAISDAPPIKPPKGATVEGVRRQIAALDAEAEAAQMAPAPRADAAQRIKAAVEDLAARGEPSVDARRREGDPSKLSDRMHGDAGLWLLVSIFKQEVTARLIERLPKDSTNTLTDAQRDRKLAELAEQRLSLERIEEALIRQAEAEGRVVARRPEAAVEALLGVVIDRGRQ